MENLEVNHYHWRKQIQNVRTVAVEEVKRLIVSMPAKTSPLDILPTKLLKSCVDTFAPIIAHLVNLSFQEGRFPKNFKSAQVTPILKKKDLDASQPQNYRLISNLNTISKILERLFLLRLDEHVKQSPNYIAVFSRHTRNTIARKRLCSRFWMTSTRLPIMGFQHVWWHWYSQQRSTRLIISLC